MSIYFRFGVLQFYICSMLYNTAIPQPQPTIKPIISIHTHYIHFQKIEQRKRSMFVQDTNTLIPCKENLKNGYILVKRLFVYLQSKLNRTKVLSVLSKHRNYTYSYFAIFHNLLFAQNLRYAGENISPY